MGTIKWDEPPAANTPRGWFMVEGTARGFYLDYGSDHYRSPHCDPRDTSRVWCSDRSPCRTCQPGNVLAVRYPAGPGTPTTSRYCETISEARAYVRTGRSDDYGHALAASIADMKATGRIPAHY